MIYIEWIDKINIISTIKYLFFFDNQPLKLKKVIALSVNNINNITRQF